MNDRDKRTLTIVVTSSILGGLFAALIVNAVLAVL